MSAGFDLEGGGESAQYPLAGSSGDRDDMVRDRKSVYELGGVEGDGGRRPVGVLEVEDDPAGVVEDVIDVGRVEGGEGGGDLGLGEGLLGDRYVSHEGEGNGGGGEGRGACGLEMLPRAAAGVMVLAIGLAIRYLSH